MLVRHSAKFTKFSTTANQLTRVLVSSSKFCTRPTKFVPKNPVEPPNSLTNNGSVTDPVVIKPVNEKIQPAVYQENVTKKDRTSANYTFVENVAEINVKRSVKNIIERSFILEQMVENGQIGVIGAMYNIETGVVDFYDDVKFIRDEENTNFSVAELRH